MNVIPSSPRSKAKIDRLAEEQVHQMALEALSKHIALRSKGEQSSPQKVFNVLLGAASRCSSVGQECLNRPEARPESWISRTLGHSPSRP